MRVTQREPFRTAPRRDAPTRPAFASEPLEVEGPGPLPRLVTASCLLWMLGVVVSGLAAAVVAVNLDVVRPRLEVGLASANPATSPTDVATAVDYTLLGTAGVALFLALVQMISIMAVVRRSRVGRALLLLAGVLNLASLFVTQALLADAQMGTSDDQLRLVGVAPLVHGALVVLASALLLVPSAWRWFARR